MYDWEIFKELRDRFLPEGREPQGPQTPIEMLDLGLKYGPYGKTEGLTIEKLKTAPHGIDLGPLKTCLPERLFTENKRIDLAPDIITADLPRVASLLTDTKAGELLLIGRRHLRSNNSWMHNSHRLVKGPKRCTLMLHPDDAAAMNLEDSTSVSVSSRVGSLVAELEITDEVMPGVVSLPHGWGHDKPGSRWKIAEAHAGVSCNDITDEQLVDPLTGNSAVNGVPVTVEMA